MNLKQIVNRDQEAVRFFSLFIICTLFFLSVVGSYRFFVVYGLYFLSKVLKLERTVILIFLPAFVVTFYLDVINGPILQPGTKSHFLLILPLFLIVGSLVGKMVKQLIIHLSEGKFFIVCPSCRFHNVHIVDKCNKCAYRKEIGSILVNPKISSSFCGDKIEPRLLDLLRDSASEDILFHKKLASDTRTLKNGTRQVRKHIFITPSHLIILDYYGFHLRMPDGWREKDIVQLSNIVSIEGARKRVFYAWRPSLIINTANSDVYEIVLSSFGNSVDDINRIAAIVSIANPNIKTNLRDLTSLPVYSESDGRLLRMLPLVLLLLALALWQLFQHVKAHGLN